MRVLLDESVPRSLKRELPGHEVSTVREVGWAGLKNGALLAAMLPAGYDVLLTVDQNLQYQQNLEAVDVAIIVMVARSNRRADLLPLIPSVRRALNSITPGTLCRIEN